MREISIVVPVFNSQDCLDELADQIARAMRTIDYELILVNDVSTDGSWKKIVSLVNNSDNIVGINLKKNSGQDNAIMAGLTQAIGNYIVIMDDDLQHSPNDIEALYQHCKKGYDICYAVFEKKQTAWKNLGSTLNGFFSRMVLKKPKDLYLSPFKIISASFLKEILKYQGPFPYIDGIVLSLSSNIGQIKTQHHERHAGKGNYSVYKSISVFLKHATGYSLYPLRVVTLAGLFTSALSCLLAAYFVLDYITHNKHVEGWITLVLLVVFFNGLILMCLGFIGEYIGRIYLTLTWKRQYAIDEIIRRVP